jgi:hypothetical protein
MPTGSLKDNFNSKKAEICKIKQFSSQVFKNEYLIGILGENLIKKK